MAAVTPARVACDAMLKGVARWLRAAGHDATWRYGIGDDEVVAHALAESRVLLTSDAGILVRRAVARGEVQALLVPRERSALDGARFVVERLGLPVLDLPRCMTCGGELLRIDKESARAEIPPRTYAWLDEFFRCARCRKIFWRGSHFDRIERGLAQLHCG